MVKKEFATSGCLGYTDSVTGWSQNPTCDVVSKPILEALVCDESKSAFFKAEGFRGNVQGESLKPLYRTFSRVLSPRPFSFCVSKAQK